MYERFGLLMVLGYIRVSTDKQDNSKQKHLILEYAQEHKLHVDEFISVEESSRKNLQKRKITELKTKLKKNNTLIVAELSRLGRNMLEVMNLIQELNDNNINLVFIRQPELSTFNTAHSKLLLAIYSYFAESEREFISLRTKQGLAAAKASGKVLGRPVGTTGKSKFDTHHETIKKLLLKEVSIKSIWKIINNGSYMGLRNFIHENKELSQIIKQNKESLLAHAKKC